ncbi:hypothetical protein PHAVU_004G103200 [Phaseolus vulgaris]
MIFQWVSNTTSNLVELDLSSNLLEGSTSNHFGLAMNSLQHLDLSYNVFKGEDLKSFMNICTLRSLYMHKNNMTEDLLSILRNFSNGCVRYSLQELQLSNNQIMESVSDLSIFSSLKSLDLSGNQLEHLSTGSKSLEDSVPMSFESTCNLESLDLSYNKLNEDLAVVFNYLSRCCRYSLRELYLGQNKFNGALPDFSIGILPNTLTIFPSLKGLYLDGNKLNGTISEDLRFPTQLEELSLMSNSLKGVIKDSHFTNMSKLETLELSDNSLVLKFSPNWAPTFQLGYIRLRSCKVDSFLFLCSGGVVGTLYQLDLSNNKLSGEIPDCWTQFKSLVYLNMSQNKFSGKIPTSQGSLLELQVLLLRNNNLTGEFSSSLRNCTKLVMLDMTENRLSGSIPDWIGSKLLGLQFLSLGNNTFNGSLPLQIFYLKRIQLLDLSLNNLSGQIPKCIKNLSSKTQVPSLRDYQVHPYMAYTNSFSVYLTYNLNAFLMWKGSEQINLLIEKIPSNIGKLTSLEFLDLSRNQLAGSIPLSLAQIDRLTVLDLSHNYLSGQIPTGTQLQSFDSSKYEGNVDLCGLPLKKLCIDRVSRQEPIANFHENDNLIFNREFYTSMTIGFVVSFWGVSGSILIIHSWRHAYFKLLSNLEDILYIIVTMKVFKWWQRR